MTGSLEEQSFAYHKFIREPAVVTLMKDFQVTQEAIDQAMKDLGRGNDPEFFERLVSLYIRNASNLASLNKALRQASIREDLAKFARRNLTEIQEEQKAALEAALADLQKPLHMVVNRFALVEQ